MKAILLLMLVSSTLFAQTRWEERREERRERRGQGAQGNERNRRDDAYSSNTPSNPYPYQDIVNGCSNSRGDTRCFGRNIGDICDSARFPGPEIGHGSETIYTCEAQGTNICGCNFAYRQDY